MQSNSVNIAGAITLWELSGMSNYSILEEGFDALNLQAYTPHMPTTQEALKIVLQDKYQGTRCLIRPLESHKGWGIVLEKAKGTALSHTNDISIVVNNNKKADLSFYGVDYSIEQEIQQAVEQTMLMVPQNKLVYSLKRILYSLCGTPIRESGGVYYLPAAALDRWREVAVIVESAGGNTVHLIQTAIDDNSVRCIMAHVRAEIDAFKGGVIEELNSGMKARAVSNRSEDIKFMLAKAEWYEREFGVLLSESKAALDELAMSLMMNGSWSDMGAQS